MNHYLACWKKYAVFTGRASRTEFWSWWLWNLALFFLASFLLALVTSDSLGATAPGQQSSPPIAGMALYVIGNLYILLSLLPSIGVSIRRLHDQDRSGWWILLNFICALGGIILLVIQTMPGTEGENRFGAPPAS
ncbi:MAG: hypothetical protein CMJ53_04075 [Planctomycetaceae bacterium]|nr:hypothetical protein [Planctomycetaceae bacterium]